MARVGEKRAPTIVHRRRFPGWIRIDLGTDGRTGNLTASLYSKDRGNWLGSCNAVTRDGLDEQIGLLLDDRRLYAWAV